MAEEYDKDNELDIIYPKSKNEILLDIKNDMKNDLKNDNYGEEIEGNSNNNINNNVDNSDNSDSIRHEDDSSNKDELEKSSSEGNIKELLNNDENNIKTPKSEKKKEKIKSSNKNDVVSPKNVVVSPKNVVVSPKNGVVSPKNVVVSPKNGVVSPKNETVLSPKKETVVSPQKDVVVSPIKEAKLASPKMDSFKLSSPKSKEPEEEVVTFSIDEKVAQIFPSVPKVACLSSTNHSLMLSFDSSSSNKTGFLLQELNVLTNEFKDCYNGFKNVFEISNLKAGTKYSYRCRAYDTVTELNSEFSEIYSFSTTVSRILFQMIYILILAPSKPVDPKCIFSTSSALHLVFALPGTHSFFF